jgi:DNA-binding Lrp family transcriptional regulator
MVFMAKKNKKEIIHDEIKVLNALERNSNSSIDSIAKNCGFSRQKVWRIIKDLEQRKIIWGYTAIDDEKAKNLTHFTLLIKRTTKSFEDDVHKEVMFDEIDNIPSGLVTVENIYVAHGMYDWVITFYAPYLVTAKKFVDMLFNRRSDYIKEYFLLETIVPIRKNGIKNPRIKDLVNYI